MKNKLLQTLSLMLCVLMLASMTPLTIFAEEERDMYITDLKVNNLVEPLGIDTVPTFRWINNMSGYARAQSAYQIIVATTAEKAAAHEGDVWDSGKVQSNLNYDIVYGGSALTSRTEYFFAVQVWDEKGESVWSDVSTFETGILDESEWSANWIGITDGDSVPCDITLDGANWIWFKDGAASSVAGTEYFRVHFTVDENKEVDEVLLATTMDDYGYLFVNCANVLTVRKETNAWKTGKVVNITPFVENGDNIFGARVVNVSSSAGIIAKIEVRYTDGSVDTTVTDKTWKCSNTATSTSGWERMGFDDTKWATPDQSVAYGNSPWYKNVVMPETMQVNVGASAPMLRKTFDVSKEIEKARLYISGLGLYELYVNGNLPDDTVLNPAHTQYDDTVHYRAYDVTDMLAMGKNALAVELGNYFYNCDFYTWMNWNTASYRDNPKLFLELHVDYTDGTSQTVISDESWKTYEYGPVTYNNIYLGESYDATKAVDGWNTSAFDDSSWKNAISVAAPTGDLVFENMEPLRRIETFTPTVHNKGNGTFIIENPVMTTG
ncbi:MAG: alpha-L-rhamnosidase N-terminal domain-containing protein [Clostridia bacterium]|nr:alpha-L-rhamnosidase N-terminal domain-containing protein [Clostridia bacterium]